jgi:hypothetical protein
MKLWLSSHWQLMSLALSNCLNPANTRQASNDIERLVYVTKRSLSNWL